MKIDSPNYGAIPNSKPRILTQKILAQNEHSRNLLICSSLFLLSFIYFVSLSYRPSFESISSSMLSQDSSSDYESIISALSRFSLKRVGYDSISLFSDNSSFGTYNILNNITTIIEPYSNLELDILFQDDSQSSYYKYTLCAVDHPEITCKHGMKHITLSNLDSSIYFECDPDDHYTFELDVSSYDSFDNKLNSYSGTAVCLYVRREIRTLSEGDLDRTMDAMHTLWITGEEEGQVLFGEYFHSSSYFTELHHFNAAWQDSDHIHEGNGFLPQHMKITNMFERAMQSVDPSVSLPYWDFTIDEALGLAVHQSYPMQERVFGNITLPAQTQWGFTYSSDLVVQGAIPNGRWANLRADPMPAAYSSMSQAGYGYLRAPWNMNPSPYISRFVSNSDVGATLPTCSSHHSVLRETSLASFSYQMSFSPHATAHSLSGGVYGCDLFRPLLRMGRIESEAGMMRICSQWVFYLKEFYRNNNILPNYNCSLPSEASPSFSSDLQEVSCGFSCSNESLPNLLSNLQAKLSKNLPSEAESQGESWEGWADWLSFVCGGDGGRIFGGDQIESASPADPSFWVIHPTLERLLQAKLMAGGFDDPSWPSDPIDQSVCDKPECYEQSSDGEVDLGYWSECCEGHYLSSQLMDHSQGQRCLYFGETNEEILSASDPSSPSYSLRFVYDSFSWSHCIEEKGLDLEGLLNSLSAARQTGSFSPTLSPTRKPTEIPTPSPSSSISADPTYSPDHTSIPTLRPSHRPTSSPVQILSICPSPPSSSLDLTATPTSLASMNHLPITL